MPGCLPDRVRVKEMTQAATTQTRIPCVLMRGGTSRGPFFLATDLPDDVATRDRVLLAVMGSPHPLQVDGIGGGNTLTSKVAIVGRSRHPGADVDYLFAQVSVDRAIVDTSPNCGNMLSGVGPFAIEAGLVTASDPETTLRIYNINTESLVEAVVQTPGGRVTYEGDVAIDGAPGTAAPVKLTFLDAVGSVTGKLLPTGRARDVIDGVPVSCVDNAMPMMILAAESVGKTGYESPAELDADRVTMARLERLRREAGRLMGLGDVADRVVPKIGLVAPPRDGGSIASRYFTPLTCHKSYAVTGSICLATACALPGTVAADYARLSSSPRRLVQVEHPAGRIEVELLVSGHPDHPEIERAALVRTARRLFEGYVLVPRSIWPGRGEPAVGIPAGCRA